MPFRVAIRADGNSEIGFGHIIRTQALAVQLIKQGAEVIFLTKNPENIIGYGSCLIPGDIRLNEEDGFISNYLMASKQDMLVIDSYTYDQERLDRAGQLELRTVYIDDMNLYNFNVDYVVNGNLYAPRLGYQGRARFLLGSEYLLMREAFQNIPRRELKTSPLNILISFGAADTNNITSWILQKVKNYHNFHSFYWHVVVGPAFRNQTEITAVAGDKANISLHVDPDIKTLMNFADIAISTAGSTTYELATCGIPSVLVVAADNQRMLAAEAERQGIALDLGWFAELNSKKLYAALDALLGDLKLRQYMASSGQKIIDGRGAERVANILLSGKE